MDSLKATWLYNQMVWNLAIWLCNQTICSSKGEVEYMYAFNSGQINLAQQDFCSGERFAVWQKSNLAT